MQLKQDILNGAQYDCAKTNTRQQWFYYMKINKRAHTLDLLCIRRTRIMRIYLLRRRALVEAAKPMEEVVACGIAIGTFLIVWEVIRKGRTREFLGEEIDLVQEQDLRGGFQDAKGRREGEERTIGVLTNHRELHIKSKRVRASCIRF
jgi:hypothetical protein